MRTGSWIKLFLLVLISVFAYIFYVQNMMLTMFHFPFWRSFQFQLIHLLLMASGVGAMAALGVNGWVQAKIKRGHSHEHEDGEELELFSEEHG